MDINTCYETTNAYHAIAFYAHLVPTVLALFLSSYTLIKTKASKLAIAFFAFTVGFSLWLIGDVFTWTSSNYDVVYFTWSWLDAVNIAFYALGAYFFGILTRERISLWEKLVLFGLCVPAFVMTALDMSLLDFYQPVCEATENATLTLYKIIAEWVIIGMVLLSFMLAWTKSTVGKRLRTGTILAALLLFYGVFSSTEYIATTTNIYEINLYGLFILPLFLIVMTYAITNLGIFEFRLLGTQILAYALIIMVGSQLLFLQDTTESTLSLITLGITIFFAFLLLQNAKKEEQARVRIEELAKELEKANKQQVILIHFITHQIKGFVTKSRNIFSMMKDGDFGVAPEAMRPMIEEGLRSDTKGVSMIQEILNAANIKSGKVAYSKEPFDLKALVDEIGMDLKTAAEAKGLTLKLETGTEPLMYPGDKGQLVNALKNLIDNSIKYTLKGEVRVKLVQEEKAVRFTVEDTGVGITQEDMKNLFTEGGHGTNSAKINVESTGFGLYIVKNIIEAHNGKVWAESDGEGKGSQFIAELPV